MDAEEKRRLKALGKAEVERRSAELNANLEAANPAPSGSEEWAAGYKKGSDRERWLRQKLPLLDRKTLEELFVVTPYKGVWVPHIGGYIVCKKCGSAAPSALPPRLFYWARCECGNIRWRCLLFLRKCVVADSSEIEPVKLIGKA